MAEAEVRQASVMPNLEHADVVGDFSALRPFGQDYFFRVLDIVKAGKILETEIEVLGLRSGTLPSETLERLVNKNMEKIRQTRKLLWTRTASLGKPSSTHLYRDTGKQP